MRASRFWFLRKFRVWGFLCGAEPVASLPDFIISEECAGTPRVHLVSRLKIIFNEGPIITYPSIVIKFRQKDTPMALCCLLHYIKPFIEVEAGKSFEDTLLLIDHALTLDHPIPGIPTLFINNKRFCPITYTDIWSTNFVQIPIELEELIAKLEPPYCEFKIVVCTNERVKAHINDLRSELLCFEGPDLATYSREESKRWTRLLIGAEKEADETHPYLEEDYILPWPFRYRC